MLLSEDIKGSTLLFHPLMQTFTGISCFLDGQLYHLLSLNYDLAFIEIQQGSGSIQLQNDLNISHSFRYTEIANNFQKEETVLNIDFVLLDNSPLKFALLGHCNEWQSKFTTLLREMGSQKLLELHNFLKDNAKK